MSFYKCIKKHLLNGEKPNNEEFYIDAVTQALNEWFNELEFLFKKPFLKVSGTLTNPATGVTTELIIMDGFLKRKKIFFDRTSVKNALWCGDPLKSYSNLFKLVGDIFYRSFREVNTLTIHSYRCPSLLMTIKEKFKENGDAFLLKIIGINDPNDFHIMLGEYLFNSIKFNSPYTLSINGVYLGNIFNGTVLINFMSQNDE